MPAQLGGGGAYLELGLAPVSQGCIWPGGTPSPSTARDRSASRVYVCISLLSGQTLGGGRLLVGDWKTQVANGPRLSNRQIHG